MQNNLVRPTASEAVAVQETKGGRNGQLDRQAHERRVIEAYASKSRLSFNPTEKSSYLNIGYWRDGAKSLDEAAEAMARLLGRAAEFQAHDYILDVGCGFGDAAILWSEEFSSVRLVGIDINPSDIEVARARAAELGLDQRLEFRVASAVELPFEGEVFDKVVALESAHHFLTREKFFHESFRVLKPGGKLVLADLLPLAGVRFQPFFNPHNKYTQDVYEQKLYAAGYSEVTLSSIRDDVFRPYSNFIRNRLRFWDVKGRFNVALHRLACAGMDYILAVAVKPLS